MGTASSTGGHSRSGRGAGGGGGGDDSGGGSAGSDSGGDAAAARRSKYSRTFSSRFRDGMEEEEDEEDDDENLLGQVGAASGFSLQLLKEESRRALVPGAAASLPEPAAVPSVDAGKVGGGRGSPSLESSSAAAAVSSAGIGDIGKGGDNDGGGGGGGGGGAERRLDSSRTSSAGFPDGAEDKQVRGMAQMRAASGFSLMLLSEESRKALIRDKDGDTAGGGGRRDGIPNISPTFSSRFFDGMEEEEDKEVQEKTDSPSGSSLMLLSEESRKALLNNAAAKGRGRGDGDGGSGGTSRRLNISPAVSSCFFDGTDEEEGKEVHKETDAASGFNLMLLKEESRKALLNDEATGGDGKGSGIDNAQRVENSLTFASRFRDGTEVEEDKEKRGQTHAASGISLKLLEESRKILVRDAVLPLSKTAIMPPVDAGKHRHGHRPPSLVSSSACLLYTSPSPRD